ncbi:unnamed protein product [Symbiodinium sp. CCMP2592]|nr:unnamed protein product [Symbiodinium sp. CCMP2592]
MQASSYLQETPTSLAITDLDGRVQSVQFAGEDLNLGTLTGSVRFNFPSAGEALLSQYALHRDHDKYVAM